MRLSQDKTGEDNKGNGINLEDAAFRIGDDGMIMTILRDRMYANPIHITCQEVMSNARDAHREAGKSNIPIKIALPVADESTLRIVDQGPGISAQRMNEIFIAYGCSTKRDDDVQTGGFGLGAKTPWSYTDWFEIKTTAFDSDLDCIMRREYRAYLDEDRRSRLALKEEEACNSETATGTEIIVPVKNNEDREAFAAAVSFIGDYWELIGGVRPEITRGAFAWTKFQSATVDSDVGWMVLWKEEVPMRRRSPHAVVDGIPYPIDIASLQIGPGQPNQTEANKRLWNVRDLAISLFFDTGEVDLAASRETLEYNAKTIEIILFRFGVCLDLMATKLMEPVNAATDLWKATIAYRKQRDVFQKFLPVSALMDYAEWQDVRLSGEDIEPEHDQWDVRLYTVTYNDQRDPPWKSVNRTYRMTPTEDALLVVDDTFGKRPARSRLYTLFLNNPHIKRVYVFLLKESNSKLFLEAMNGNILLDRMNPIPLSTVEPTKLPRKSASRPRGSRPSKVFVYYDPNLNVRQWTPVEKDLAYDKLFYVVKYYKDAFLDFARTRRVPWTVKSYADAWGVVIHGVVMSQEGKLPHSTPFAELMKREFAGMVADQEFMFWEREWLAHQQGDYRLPFVLNPKSALIEGIRKRTGDNHPIVRYADHLVQVMKFRERAMLIENLRSDLGRGHNHDLEKSIIALMTSEIDTRFPLLYALHGSSDRIANMDAKLLEYVENVDNGDL